MAYSEAELAAAGQRLAQALQQINARLESVESKPAVDQMTADWQAGREFAEIRGYGDAELNRLEDQMQSRGILHHQDAVALDPVRPSGRDAIFGGVAPDDMNLLMQGGAANEDAFLSRVMDKIRRGQ